MNKIKRIVCVLLCALMLPAMLSGCGKKKDTDEPFVFRASI